MPVICPCCRAGNESGPGCRRCKADLGLLFALEARRAHLLATAARTGDLAAVREAESLRPGNDARELRAALQLAAGNYPAALAAMSS